MRETQYDVGDEGAIQKTHIDEDDDDKEFVDAKEEEEQDKIRMST